MRNIQIVCLLTLFLHLATISDLSGQSWNFVKERDHIKLYSRVEGNGSLKSFKGVVDIHADMEKVSSMIGNVTNFEWWGENIREIKVLFYEKDKHIQYYLIYDAPWPFMDRDLVADVHITTDPSSGTRSIYSHPLLNVIPENPDLVRVTSYWQRWTIQPLNNGMIHLTLEGFIDPAGSIPSWLYNMLVIETPLKLMREVQKRVNK
ncbi:MAG TPA: hypothetical protein VFE66_00165 [Bacteroidales bacterium]|nr:hypothetical protein [Bacteroidales bacterium]